MRTREHRRDGSVDRRDRSSVDTAPFTWLNVLAGAFLALLALFALSPNAPALAAQFDVHAGEDLNVIVVTEEILPGDDDRFLDAVQRATSGGQNALVVLASPGGALGAGMHMGLIISENGLPTFVPDREICASACALAWLAGAPRMMTTESEIGFHQPYDERDGEMVPSIEANAVVGHYIATIGMGPQIVSFAVSAPPDQMAWLDLGTAGEVGLEVTEVAASDAPLMPRNVAGVDRRSPPVDDTFFGEPTIPAPVMRGLTPSEVASLQLTGTVDGARDAERGLPLVTAMAGSEPGRAGMPVPWGLRLAFDVDTLAAPAFDDMNEGEIVADLNDDIAGEILHDVAVALPAEGTQGDMRNVEDAVLAAVRSYGDAGSHGLRNDSADCWRTMRDAPSVRRMQFCHVFDLVAAEVAGAGIAHDFAPFAIAVRLRAHRAMIDDDALIPLDFADRWGSEASMVVAAMIDG